MAKVEKVVDKAGVAGDPHRGSRTSASTGIVLAPLRKVWTGFPSCLASAAAIPAARKPRPAGHPRTPRSAASDARSDGGAARARASGLAYQPQLRRSVEARGDTFDFVEAAPEVVWNDLGPGRSPQCATHDAGAHAFPRRSRPGAARSSPHGVGSSIGSAHRFDHEHLAQMARWHEWLRFPLAQRPTLRSTRGRRCGPAGEVEPRTSPCLPALDHRETLELRLLRACSRCAAGCRSRSCSRTTSALLRGGRPGLRRGGVPERAAPATAGAESRWTWHNTLREPAQPGAGAPTGSLDRLNLDAVVEVHVAGGMEFEGFSPGRAQRARPARGVGAARHRPVALPERRAEWCSELFGTWHNKAGGVEGLLLRQLGCACRSAGRATSRRPSGSSRELRGLPGDSRARMVTDPGRRDQVRTGRDHRAMGAGLTELASGAPTRACKAVATGGCG